MAKIIGIDLGTTNSVVAVIEGGEPTVIPTRRAAARRRPSSRSPIRRAPGRQRRQAPGVTNPEQHDLRDQALHGPQYDEVTSEAGDRPVQDVTAPNGDAWVEVGGRSTRRRRSAR